MGWLWRKIEKPELPPKEPECVTLYAADDLMTRAEKIVRMMGFRGAVAGHVLETYRVLQIYERLDKEAVKVTEC